jgi:peroxiredoxin
MQVSRVILAVLAFTAAAWAEVPFKLDAFQQSQKNNEKILLHFHADWCPTCKAQKKVLSKLSQEGALKGITVYEVNYDEETAFKKEMKVTQQATFISFYGGAESGRVTGITGEEEIKTYIDNTLVKLTLKDQLRLMKETSAKRIPPEKAKILEAAIEKLRKAHLTDKALKVGQTMPDFSLPDAHGNPVRLKDLLKKGPVIVTFYRGSWCPYCNAQLASYQQHLPEFRAHGASLVAITPEKPELTLLTEEKKKLEFPILTDAGNKLATKFGLVFGVTGELKDLYRQFGVDLEKSQGNAEWKLPIPATYVVSSKGTVIYAFLDVDYTNRADPSDLLKAIGQ